MIETLCKQLGHPAYTNCSDAMFSPNIKTMMRAGCLVLLEKGRTTACPHLTSHVWFWIIKAFVWNFVRVSLLCNQWDSRKGTYKAIWKKQYIKYYSCSCNPCIFKAILILECLQDTIFSQADEHTWILLYVYLIYI